MFLLAPTAHVASYAGEVEDAKEEVRNNPDDALAHFFLGVAYAELGMQKEAIGSLKQAIRIDPDHAKAHFNLGSAYYNSGMYKKGIESLKQAVVAYKQIIRINPDDAGAHFHLGLIYYGLDDRGSAIEQYKILKKLDTEWAKMLLDYIDKHTQP